MVTVQHQTFAALSFAGVARAGALTGLLVLVGAVSAAAEPMTISCGYGESGYPPECGWSSDDGSETATFEWEDYFFELTLYNVSGDGSVNVTPHHITNEEFQDKLEPPDDIEDFEAFSAVALSTAELGSYVCIPLVDPGTSGASCVEFEIHADDTLDWSNYQFKIDWQYDSHNNGYNGSGGLARVLRDIDDDGVYDEDMCIEADLGGENYVPCEYSPFPFIISGNTDFSTVIPALALVPEPATVALLGTGVIGLWYRRRSRTL
jgi:hypothetical protein